MEFMNRGNRPTHTASAPVEPSATNSGRSRRPALSKGMRIASVALLFSATILIVALLAQLVLGSPRDEGKYVDEDQLQAVFLNGGQVYFGNIQDVNDKFLRLDSIFYLRVNQQVQPKQGEAAADNQISLVKLGCELHRPTNEMIINRDQVVFWENLKDDDAQNTVPGAVKEYLKQYPNGQECEDTSQQGNNAPSTEAEGN